MTEVLIAGAGPTGLMMACQLSIFNIPFRIIDKNEDRTTQSRAIVIHAASMELFARMDIADQFLTLGKPVSAVNYIVKKRITHIPLFSRFGKGVTEFPFFLALEQSQTEKILVSFLEQRGHFIERRADLVSLSQTGESVSSIVQFSDGRKETIVSRWLVGADGAKSLVRHQLGIPFGGETYPLDLFVLDCRISWPLKNDELSLAFSTTSFAGFFPLPEGRCRVISFVPEELQGKPEITFEEVNAGFARRMQLDIRLYDPVWISTYRAHHRYVSEFRKGRCFLAGDAAHVHSPVGAQGMNTGFQDACNLAWKLAFVSKGWAKENLLRSYQEERLPFAKQLVRSTDRAFAVAVSKNVLVRRMLMSVAPLVLSVVAKTGWMARYLFARVSQIGIRYSKSLLTSNGSNGSFPRGAPRCGQRLPFSIVEDEGGNQVNLQQLVKGELKVLLFNKTGTATGYVEELVRRYPGISVTHIPFNKKNRPLYKLFGIDHGGFYLVRPDLYIAYRSSSLETEHFRKYLDVFYQ